MAEHLLFRGGVHPHEGKELSSGRQIAPMPLLERYTVPLQQHIGAPPKTVVKKKDKVRKGQLLAEAGGFVSASIHSPTSGTVTRIDACLGPAGTKVSAVEITSDGEDAPDESLEPITDWRETDPANLKERIADAGIVGMGGAAFPTSVKLSPPPAKPIDVLIINGVECEPCLTADHRLMLEEADKILEGALIIARVLNVKDIYIAVEKNKPDAIDHLTRKAEGTPITVHGLRVRYPQGAEKQLIYALTGRKVPTGGLPMDVGAVVQNVGTALAVDEAVTEGKPLYERVTTVTGTPVVHPGNWRMRVGTSVEEALKAAGGVQEDPAKLIAGGPMMGQSLYSLSVPVMKNTSGILLLAASEVSQFTSHPCIRCGRCVDACPMALMPGTLSVQIENERYDLADNWRVLDCIECGCCAYVCPAYRPMVQHMKRAKTHIMTERKRAAKASSG